MKVRELLNKLDDLKNIRDYLEKRANDTNIISNDAELMDRAAEAIEDYIQELYRKEVKV